jgi:hypothetical protein
MGIVMGVVTVRAPRAVFLTRAAGGRGARR